jgi:hypothetical protein
MPIAVDFTGHGIRRVLLPLLVRRQARKEMPATRPSTNSGIQGAAVSC